MTRELELEELLRAESERVEWKESGKDESDVLHSVCAFANDLRGSGLPGYLLIGVREDGRAIGTDASDRAQLQLANRLRSTAILPHPSCDIVVESWQGLDLLVVRVTPSQVPPIVKVRGVPWVRIGTSTHRAIDADQVRLSERKSENQLQFDLRACAGSSLEDLRLTSLRELFLAERDGNDSPETFPSFEKWLSQRDLLRSTPDGWVPTNTAMLMYGFDAQRFLPGAYVEFVRYAGSGFGSAVVARRTISGTLPDQLDGLWSQLRAQWVAVPGATDGIRTPYEPEYPEDALRELARNLIQHRLYEGTNAPGRISWLEDRVVFSNPGSRFGRSGEGAFGEHSDYRNPTITRLLVELGYVERLGRGISLVRSALKKGGNPDLEVESDGFVTVTVRRCG